MNAIIKLMARTGWTKEEWDEVGRTIGPLAFIIGMFAYLYLVAGIARIFV